MKRAVPPCWAHSSVEGLDGLRLAAAAFASRAGGERAAGIAWKLATASFDGDRRSMHLGARAPLDHQHSWSSASQMQLSRFSWTHCTYMYIHVFGLLRVSAELHTGTRRLAQEALEHS